MPFYYGLKTREPKPLKFSQEDRKRTAERLLLLREKLRGEVPSRTVSESLLLATWNIREFGSNKRSARLAESLYYIAEIISAFDIVAVQEVNADMAELERVMRILGRNWRYIATDVTEGASGNRERLVFVYDSAKVTFQNIAGEIVLPEGSLVTDTKQFARTPFMVAYQSGWFKFMLATVHIYYGKEGQNTPEFARRVAEIEKIALTIAERAKEDAQHRFVLLGDFNIVSPEHKTMEALRKQGYFIHPELMKKPSNYKRDMHYDQIAFRAKADELLLGDGRVAADPAAKKNAGVFDFNQVVFTDSDFKVYKNTVKEQTKLDDSKLEKEYLSSWRTYQMSDHFPMWVEMKIDFADRYLAKIAQP